MRWLRLERDWHGKRLHQVQVSRLSSSATFQCDIAPGKRQPLPRVHLECQVHRLRSWGGGADWSEPAIGRQSAFKEQRRLEKFELLPWSFNTVFFWVKWQHGHAVFLGRTLWTELRQELLTDGKKAGEKHNIHCELYPDFMSPLKSAIDYFTVQPRKKRCVFTCWQICFISLCFY